MASKALSSLGHLPSLLLLDLGPPRLLLGLLLEPPDVVLCSPHPHPRLAECSISVHLGRLRLHHMLPRLEDARVQGIGAVVAVEQAAAAPAGRAVGAVAEEAAARVAAGGVVGVAVGVATGRAGDGAGSAGRGRRHVSVAVEEAVLAGRWLGSHGLGLVDGLWGGLAAAEERHDGCVGGCVDPCVV